MRQMFVCLAFVLPVCGRTEILISSLSTNSPTLITSILPTQSAALGFQISTQSYGLVSVSANLSMNAMSDLKATIYSGSGYRPENPVIDLNVHPPFPEYERTNYIFTPKAPAVLNANTRYWLLLQTTNGSFTWNGLGTYTGTGATFVGFGELAANGFYYPEPNNPGVSIQIEGLPVGSDPTLEIRTAVELRWTTIVGKTYQIQWSPSVEGTNWSNLGDVIIGDGLPRSVLESTTPQKRFYRIESY